MVVVFVALKFALVLLLGLPYLWGKLSRRFGSARVMQRLRARSVNHRLSVLESSLKQQGRSKSSTTRELQRHVSSLNRQWSTVNWVKVLKTSFLLLYVAYPGVALNVMRMFHCVQVNSQYFLVADMRLQCYTSQWAGYVRGQHTDRRSHTANTVFGAAC